jgi:hypothetical protein
LAGDLVQNHHSQCFNNLNSRRNALFRVQCFNLFQLIIWSMATTVGA